MRGRPCCVQLFPASCCLLPLSLLLLPAQRQQPLVALNSLFFRSLYRAVYRVSFVTCLSVVRFCFSLNIFLCRSCSFCHTVLPPPCTCSSLPSIYPSIICHRYTFTVFLALFVVCVVPVLYIHWHTKMHKL